MFNFFLKLLFFFLIKVTHLSLTRYSLPSRLNRQAMIQKSFLSQKSITNSDIQVPEAAIDFDLHERNNGSATASFPRTQMA